MEQRAVASRVSGPPLDAARDRLVPRLAKPPRQLLSGPARQFSILGADDKVRAVPSLPEERIAADRDSGMRGFGLAQQVGDLAFGRSCPDRHRHDRTTALELARQRL